jgi:hypothetical protein
MRALRRSGHSEQLILFHPPRRLPRWEKLPAAVREDVVRLLAKMLREHLTRQTGAHGEGGATDE